ncbi:MAG: KH domain-containing protein [bacterium]|nr:KH domain-containing protein [bacterium]
MNTVDANGGEDGLDLANEEELLRSFAVGLIEAFGVDASVTTTRTDDGALEVAVDGDEVGLLIGRRGTTLAAIEELLRVVVQRRAQGRRSSKVRLEVGGYKRRRKEALESFARRIAAEVVETGQPRILEPMNAVDRKIVHDAIVELTGVETASEGEEPRRRVVVRPGG